MSYTPRNPPANVNELSGFLAIELQKIAQEWGQPQPFVYLSTSYAEPTKPREGMMAKADGTTWNPGSGSGVYCYIAGAWVLLHSNGRELLTGDRTYYVRTDGSDSNSGISDTAGGAFLTIQKAATVVASLDIGTFNATIKVADGTYSGAVQLLAPHGSGWVYLIGNTTTPSNVLLTGSATRITTGAKFLYGVSGFKMASSAGGGIQCSAGANLVFTNIEFGACSSYHVQAVQNGIITVNGNYSISGSTPYHIYCTEAGIFTCLSKTITLTGTPNFSAGFALGMVTGVVVHNGCTFSGACTGTRYVVTMNGVIQTYGSGDTYLPGSIDGTKATGGQYA